MAERVLVITTTELAGDARVTRQVEFLAADYDIVVAAFGKPAEAAGVEFVELPARLPQTLRRRAETAARIGLRTAGRYERAYWLDERVRVWLERLRAALPVDAIVVNDLYTLPLAFALGDAVPVIFDAREHWTSESASWTRVQRLSMRRAHEWLVDRYVPRISGMVTVSPGIARDFEQRAGVKPRLLTNAPYFQALTPTEVSEPIRLVHMGVADERRRLESTIEAVRSLDDRFTLDLVLARDNDYRRRIEQMVAADPQIRLLPPVPLGEVVRFANGYDVGVHLFPAQHPNQVHSLPNKLFDYVQARLAIAIGPSPAMAEIVREWDCGIVSESFEPDAFAASLAQLTPARVAEMKRNSDRAAQVLTAEQNRETMLAVVREAIAAQKVGQP